MVTLSPAERESTTERESTMGRRYSMTRLSEFEHAVLSGKLAEIRHGGKGR